MDDVSDVEMELDKDEEAIDDRKSEENKNVEFEEEVIFFILILNINISSKQNIVEEKLWIPLFNNIFFLN